MTTPDLVRSLACRRQGDPNSLSNLLIGRLLQGMKTARTKPSLIAASLSLASFK